MTYTEMELLEAAETFVLRLEQATQNLSRRERLQIAVRLREELQHMQ